MKSVWPILLASGLVAGCAGGGTFGGLFSSPGQQQAIPVGPVESGAGLALAEGSVVLPAVENVDADRSRQGVILRARAIAPRQGFWGGALVSTGSPAESGVEVVEFRAFPPIEPHPVGTPRSRLIEVGRFYSNAEMQAINSFRVIAGQNALSVAAPPPLPAPPPPPLPEF